jgi:hypothetical protein
MIRHNLSLPRILISHAEKTSLALMPLTDNARARALRTRGRVVRAPAPCLGRHRDGRFLSAHRARVVDAEPVRARGDAEAAASACPRTEQQPAARHGRRARQPASMDPSRAGRRARSRISGPAQIFRVSCFCQCRPSRDVLKTCAPTSCLCNGGFSKFFFYRI